ncbi:MAG TPA: hypothetical protein VKG82_10105 [Solirubrobacteraceae bacterium]|nr:hypothetical protein [Solirubrobacteraceae bacterium]HME04337.1 hypothetical protein [Solirubrobacteraceae bacterium]
MPLTVRQAAFIAALGNAGYWLMSVTALFATAGATNAGLCPAPGLCGQMASVGEFPPSLGRRLGERVPVGLLITAALAAVLAVGFDLSAIASIGSAIALLVFALVTIGHLRLRAGTQAKVWVLALAIISTVAVFATFVFTTLVNEPKTMITMGVILLVGVALDLAWKHRRRGRRHQPSSPASDAPALTTAPPEVKP